MATKERIKTILSRKYYLLSSNYHGSFKSHKIYDQFLILDFSILKGVIEIEIENLNTNVIFKFSNINEVLHEFKLDKNTKYAFRISAGEASGYHSLKIKTIKRDDHSIIY
jgi:hypothetical protein